jgi:hypothetical protein
MATIRVLSGIEIEGAHKSRGTVPPNAHITADYPDGFRIRCKRADWIERTRYGVRWVHATSDERHDRPDFWRKPKAAQYQAIMVLYVIDDPAHEEYGHIRCDAVSPYTWAKELATFRSRWEQHLSPAQLAILDSLERVQEAMSKRKVVITETTYDIPTA